MRRPTAPEDATLLDVLIDGFEKNEVLNGFHWRRLPLPDADAAARTFTSFTEEARRWKGEPARLEEKAARRIASWPDLEIRQAGRGVLVRARTASFHSWWHDERMWQGDPLDPIIDWIVEEGESK